MLSLLLKDVLKAEGKTNYRLSKDLNIDQAQLSRFFRGKGSISLKNLERILNYLGYDITLNKAMRREEEKVKSKTPAQKDTNYQYSLRCSKCGESYPYSIYGKTLTNEMLQKFVCPFCSERGHVVVERPPTTFKINTEKKRQAREAKMKRKMMELPFKDPLDKEM